MVNIGVVCVPSTLVSSFQSVRSLTHVSFFVAASYAKSVNVQANSVVELANPLTFCSVFKVEATGTTESIAEGMICVAPVSSYDDAQRAMRVVFTPFDTDARLVGSSSHRRTRLVDCLLKYNTSPRR